MNDFQSRVAGAHVALFADDPTNVPERCARFFEESNETCQAFGMTLEEAHALVDYVYSRPVGEPAKEIGAASLTLASLCVVAGYDRSECEEADLAKLVQPETIARIRAKRSTRHGRGPLPGLDPVQATIGPIEIPGKLEFYEGKLLKVVDARRTGWWRFHEHYDRNGYCDNPSRGY